MPRFDGTGPTGQGPMTGRGMGPCAGGYGCPYAGFCPARRGGRFEAPEALFRLTSKQSQSPAR